MKVSTITISTEQSEARVPKFRSIRRAEKWCEQHYNLYFGCSFKDCDMDAVNPTIRQLVALEREYPEVANQFRILGSHGAFMNPETDIAAVGEKISGMKLNPLFYDDAYLLLDRLETMELLGESPEGCGCIEYLATHEFAHEIAYWLQARSEHVEIGRYSGAAWDVFDRWLRAHRLTSQISLNAKRSHDEFFADAFASCYHSPQPLESAREVLTFVKEIVNQIRVANVKQHSKGG